MLKYNLVNSMLGNQYPFFLSNHRIGETYYLYQLISPSLSPECIPYISMTKISERIKNEFGGKDSDIISVCLGSRHNIEFEAMKFIEKVILPKDSPVVVKNGNKFPLVEMESGNNLQKAVVINLRDQIRRKNYKMYPGRFIDVLWTSNQFVVFRLEDSEDKNSFKLIPEGIYNNSDVELEHPLDVPLSKLGTYQNLWPKNKISELVFYIKRLEWESFRKKNF